MIVTGSSISGAPGVSSLLMMLAAGWPAEYASSQADLVDHSRMGRVVLEADVDGGRFGARYGVGVEPGASTLVSLTRRGDMEVDLDEVGRRVGDEAWLIPGPESSEGARHLWSGRGVAESVGTFAATDPRVWFVDAGRASSVSPLAPLLSKASLSLLFCRADQDSLVQVPPRVADLRRVGCSVGVVVVGKALFSTEELSEFFDTSQLWTVPAGDDLVGLSRDVWTSKKVRRSWLWRGVVDVAHDVAEQVVFRVMPTQRTEEV